MIGIAHPEIAQEEIDAVNAVLKSGILAQGPVVAELESQFAKYCDTDYSSALNSGTAAIHCALYAAGVGEGDEVITTPFSFIASINPILMLGAKPVLVDIEPDSFCIDTTKIEAAITDKTKAIVPVHVYGQPADMDEINAIASKHNIVVVEDACQAVGAEYGGRKTGSLGDIGCFSLYATKNIMCGEGGMLTTSSQAYDAKTKQFRQHGMVAPYMYDDTGYNYRTTDLLASIAVEQLKKVDRFSDARRSNAQKITDGLAGVDGLVLPTVKPNRTHVYHQYTVRITDECGVSRDDFVDKMREMGVGVGVYYPKALHSYPHIQKLGYTIGDFPVAEKVASEVVSLPVHPGLSDEDIDAIVNSAKEVLHG